MSRRVCPGSTLYSRLIEFKEAYKAGDKLTVQRVALKQRKVYEELDVSSFPAFAA